MMTTEARNAVTQGDTETEDVCQNVWLHLTDQLYKIRDSNTGTTAADEIHGRPTAQ